MFHYSHTKYLVERQLLLPVRLSRQFTNSLLVARKSRDSKKKTRDQNIPGLGYGGQKKKTVVLSKFPIPPAPCPALSRFAV